MELRLSLKTLTLLSLRKTFKQLSSKILGRIFNHEVFTIPAYDRSKLKSGHIHFGFGGFAAAHLAYKTHLVLNSGGKDAEESLNYGIIGVNIQPPIERGDQLNPQDGLYTVLAQDSAGKKTLTVVGSVLEFLYGPHHTKRVIDQIASKDTRIISMTLMPQTHQSYLDAQGNLNLTLPDIQNDLDGKNPPQTVYGYIVRGLQQRDRNLPGITIINSDNMEQNGDLFSKMFIQFVTAYDKRNKTNLCDTIKKKLTFPNSMVDRIVPKPTEQTREDASSLLGLRDEAAIGTEPMPDVSWVLENKIANGLPAWDKLGQVLLVNDATPYEQMKLRLLNGSFFGICQLAHLKGYEYVYEAAKDPLIQKYMITLMNESEPTLKPVPGVNLKAYKQEVVERLLNQALYDTVERVVNDGVPRIEVVYDQLNKGLSIETRALAFAAWIQRARVDENERGDKLEFVFPSSDVLKQKAREGDNDPSALLNETKVFGKLGTYPQFVATVGKYLSLLNQPNGVDFAIKEALMSACAPQESDRPKTDENSQSGKPPLTARPG